MNFAQSVGTCFKKYVTFSGRASRSEYWWFFALTAVISISTRISFIVAGDFPSQEEGIIALMMYALSLLIIIPGLAVASRRLHDLNKSGWFCLLLIFPIVGLFLSLYWLTRKGDSGPNRFGDDPLGVPG